MLNASVHSLINGDEFIIISGRSFTESILKHTHTSSAQWRTGFFVSS